MEDFETGLYYNYFRDYDPTLGRYTEADPIGLAGGVNLYNYIYGSPVIFNDDFGLAYYLGEAEYVSVSTNWKKPTGYAFSGYHIILKSLCINGRQKVAEYGLPLVGLTAGIPGGLGKFEFSYDDEMLPYEPDFNQFTGFSALGAIAISTPSKVGVSVL